MLLQKWTRGVSFVDDIGLLKIRMLTERSWSI
jgi:hypothetical protein